MKAARSRRILLGAVLTTVGCQESLAPLGREEISSAVAIAVRKSLIIRGAPDGGNVIMRIDDTAAVRVDSLIVQRSLAPWNVRYVDYGSAERWIINGATDCACAAVVYLAFPPIVDGRLLSQEVVVVVPVGRLAHYRVVLIHSRGEWGLLRFEVVTTT